MKRIMLVATILFVAISLFSWNLDRQAQFPVNIYGLDNFGNNVVLGGSSGAVGYSTDNGETFNFVETPTYDAVNGAYVDGLDVSFSDANHVAMSAEEGMIILSADGGQTWTQAEATVALSGGSDLNGIVYLPDGKIFACGFGGVILYSADSGANWVAQTSPSTDTFYGMSMNESGTGFIAANNGNPDLGKIIKTTDFGTTWEVVDLGMASNPTTFQVMQYGNRVVVGGDDGYIGVSNDNGVTWTHHPTAGGDVEPSIYGILMDGDTGYAIGRSGVLIKTTDGWATTELIENNWVYHAEEILFDSNSDLMIAGWYGTLAKSTDNGVTWADKTVSSVDNYSISVIDEDNWYLVGDKGTIFKTDDAGSSYDKVYVQPMADLTVGTLYDSYFINNDIGIVTGKTSGVIYRTIDGGENWTNYQVPDVSSSKTFYNFEFVTEQIGWVFGHQGVSAKTTDAGATWTNLTLTGITANDRIYSAHAFDENNIILGAKSGVLYRTTNGIDFTSITVNSGDVKDVYFTDSDNGVFVNDDGDIFYTTNGGLTAEDWTAATESSTDDLNSIYETANGTLIVAGRSSDTSNLGTTWAMMKSEDNGATWTELDLPETTFNPVRLTDVGGWDNEVLVAGRNQVLYSGSIDGGTTEPDFAVDLFISEYIEGSSSNKAIEIYNGTGADIDLSEYSLMKGGNGAEWSGEEPLVGTLANMDVFIVGNSGADAAIVDVTDLASTITYFNGDDAIGLFKNGTLIDVIGVEGVDPGAAWDVAGVTEATKEYTLVRKPTVAEGTTNWAMSAGTTADDSQWIVYPQNEFTYLGTHTFVGGSSAEYVSTPVIDPATTSFTEAFDATITCSTENATIYYTLDGTDPSDASSVYSMALNITETTTLKAIAYADGLETSFIATANYNLLTVVEVANMAALRAGSTDGTVYQLTGEAFITYQQTFRGQKYLQDATGGILIDDNAGNVTTALNLGDGVTGIQGTLNEYGNMIQLLPTEDFGAATSTDNVIVPVIVTIAELIANYDTYESRVVTLEGVTFNTTGSFANGMVYEITDGTDVFSFRTTFYDLDYITTAIPEGSGSITGITNARSDGDYITARNLADFEPATAVDSGTISGTVTSAADASVIEGATVTIGSLTAVTDATGNYTIANIPVNTYSVTCSATNFILATTENVVVTLDTVTDVDFSLTVNDIQAPQNLTATVITEGVELVWGEVTLTNVRKASIKRVVLDRDPTSWKVYRDNVVIAEPTVQTYTDLNTTDGTYVYHVTAMYDAVESDASNSVSVTIGDIVEPEFAVDLFFSEYIEGSSSNKALEIFNGTGADIDLSEYSVNKANNGGDWGDAEALTGTLVNSDVFVIANADADAAVAAVADLVSTLTYFNGDDAVGLFKNNVLIDIIGIQGVDPGAAWDVAGVTEGTKEYTLVRKPVVAEGSIDWAMSAGTTADDSQWIVYPQNDFSYIGTHTFTGGSSDDYVSTPVIDPTSTSFTEAFDATITCSTENATIYYTLDGTDPSDASTVYSVALNITETATLKAIAYADGLETSFIATANYNLLTIVEVADMAALRTGNTDGTIYQLTGEAFLTYQQTFRGQKYLQDATGGILIDDNAGNVTTALNLGDGVTGISGTLSEYGNMLQLIPTEDFGAATSTGNVIVPVTVTIAELTANYDTYESRLITLDNVMFNSTDNFENGTLYELTDGTDLFSFRTTFYDVDYITTAIPVGTGAVTGIANARADGNYITSRDASELEFINMQAPQNLTATVETDGVRLEWDTAVLPTIRKAYINENGEEVVVGEVRDVEYRDPTGWKVYRDDVSIADVTGIVPSYLDPNTTDGTYVYHVTAMYDAVESGPSNSVTVTIGGAVEPIVMDSFENYADFALDFDNWTLVDGDLSPTWGIQDTDFENSGLPMAYIVFNPTATTPALATGYEAMTGDKFLACIASNPAGNDDWAMSQTVTLAATGSVSFYAKSITDQYGLERFNVLVSTAGSTNPNDFTSISGDNYVEAPIDWTNYTYSLDAYAGQAIKVAVQCVSNDAFMFMLDDFAIYAPGGTPTVSDDVEIAGTQLLSNYPNPFNPETSISFNMDNSGDVMIDIFNIKGQKVKQLLNDNVRAGNHTVVWNGKDDNNKNVSSGVYFYKMRSGKYSKTKKMILMK